MDGHKNIIKSFKPTHNYFTFADQDKDDPDNYIPHTYDNESTLNFVLSAKKYSYGTNGSNVESGYDVLKVEDLAMAFDKPLFADSI